MPPKRKAAGNEASAVPKRIRSTPATPRSLASTSDDDYTEGLDDESGAVGDDDDEFEREDRRVRNVLKQKFTVATYNQTKALGKGTLEDGATQLFNRGDFGRVELKPDHSDRPLWITPDKGKIIVESFSPRFKAAEAFLINIAEPVSRVSNMHEYTLTPHSLFAAVSVGYTTEAIVNRLEEFSKTKVPESIKEFIKVSTKSFGKVRLVLKHTRYFVESSDPSVLQTLLRDTVIGPKRIDSTGGQLRTEAAPKMGDMVIPGTRMAAGAKQILDQGQHQDELKPAEDDSDGDPAKQAERMTATLLEEDDEEEQDQVHSFEIAAADVQEISRRCRKIDYPLTEEYDFRNDEMNADLKIDLNPIAQIRPYQEQALSKMFGNGRARSGIIVLPCGAGKTLVGITAACTVKKSVIVLCTSAMSVVQWRAEFRKWSNISADDIATFTADNKNFFPGNAGIIISTYSMVTQTKGRSHDSQRIMDFITQREWGLMILDEVHVVPAQMFQKVTYLIHAHSKLGLTATLLREDDKIEDLNFLIGPKLYEANWQELSSSGYIARVQCAEVWCPMSSEFYTEYLQATSPSKRTLLFTMNPRKFQACQFLINYHESRGDKIIVFSDNVYALESYAKALGKFYIYGGTPQPERLRILENFQHNELVNTIFLSKIGDTSLDLPEATCLIQISSHYGSRRQEAQRLGRILRAKRRNDEGFNAFFYSLVSKDTQEMYYSSKRQMFLVDQGYAFKVITHLQGLKDLKDLKYSTPRERRELLTTVMLESETAAEAERIDGDLFDMEGRRGAKKRAAGVKRTAGTLGELSGGSDMAYVEYNRSRNKELKQKGNSFIRSLKRQQDKKRQAAAGL